VRGAGPAGTSPLSKLLSKKEKKKERERKGEKKSVEKHPKTVNRRLDTQLD